MPATPKINRYTACREIVDNFINKPYRGRKGFVKNKAEVIHKVIHKQCENVHKIRVSARFIISQAPPKW